MAKKSKKSTQQYKEDVIFFRISSLFILACAAIFGIFSLKNTTSGAFYRLAHTPAFTIAMGIFLLIALGYFVYCRINKIDESEKTYASINILSVAAYAFGFTFYWGRWGLHADFEMLITLTIALPLLYIIYHIYKRDFFIFSVANLLFISGIWFFIRGGLLNTVIAAVILAVSASTCYIAYKSAKKLSASDNYKHSFVPVCVSFLIAVVLVVLLNIIKIPFFTHSISWTIMFFQYLAGGIYYTIKLIREA
ncbi:MAG: hypothetical protein E7621_02845 [Ruminococcaceae bacterium]|nr:hypothetical protein [Oscillospiraceae bacterium]